MVCQFLIDFLFPPGKCGNGWPSLNAAGLCYNMFKQKESFNEAKDYCDGFGATLPISRNQEEDDLIVNLR